MSFRCGIVGLPNVGKSTLFNALTKTAQAQAANYPFCTIEPNTGEVAVPDPRLERLAATHRRLGYDVPASYVHAASDADNAAVLETLPPASLVVNASGLGKDAPGSPLPDTAKFPERGVAWDLNYRGELRFLDQARRQAAARHLRVEDGWVYFLHGWTRAIAEVFHRDIPTGGPVFDRLSQLAGEARI